MSGGWVVLYGRQGQHTYIYIHIAIYINICLGVKCPLPCRPGGTEPLEPIVGLDVAAPEPQRQYFLLQPHIVLAYGKSVEYCGEVRAQHIYRRPIYLYIDTTPTTHSPPSSPTVSLPAPALALVLAVTHAPTIARAAAAAPASKAAAARLLLLLFPAILHSTHAAS